MRKKSLAFGMSISWEKLRTLIEASSMAQKAWFSIGRRAGFDRDRVSVRMVGRWIGEDFKTIPDTARLVDAVVELEKADLVETFWRVVGEGERSRRELVSIAPKAA